MRRGRLVLLVSFWMLAWGDASVGSLVGGVVVAVALAIVFPAGPMFDGTERMRPFGLVRLGLYICVQLVTSNLLVAREILSPGSDVRTGVLAYEVRHPSDQVITLMASVITLTPGTMTVEATRAPSILYVHFLLLDDVGAARRSISRLEDLVVGAMRGSRHPGPHGAVSRGGAR